MGIRRYRFNAPDGHTLVVGSDTYGPGDEVELEESLAVDDRLSLVGESSEEADTQPADTESTDEPTEPEAPESEGLLGQTQPESAEKAEDDDAFGRPRRKSGPR